MTTTTRSNYYCLKSTGLEWTDQRTIAAPYIDCALEGFRLDTIPDDSWCKKLAHKADNLITDFQKILELVRRPVEREPFQLELYQDKTDSIAFKLRLRYDVLTWFDHILSKQSKERKIKIARDYVHQYLRIRDAEDRRTNINCRDRVDHDERIRYARFRPPQRMKNEFWEKCRKACSLVNGKSANCQMQFDESFFIDLIDLQNPEVPHSYVMQSRSESTRDILLIPTKHITNEQFAIDSDTWRAVFVACLQLREKHAEIQGVRLADLLCPIESIYFNYGSWMTAMNTSLITKTAHAHAHLLLTRETINGFTCNWRERRQHSKSDVYRYIVNLTGCYRDPDDYEYKDAIRLQNNRLLSFHIERTDTNIDKIKKTLETMQSDLQKLTKSSEQSVTREQFDQLYQLMVSSQHTRMVHVPTNSSTSVSATDVEATASSTLMEDKMINLDEINNNPSGSEQRDKRPLEVPVMGKSEKRRKKKRKK